MENKVIDLATLDTTAKADQGVEYELIHPESGEAMGIFITVAGSDSRIWRKALSDIAERNKGLRRTAELVRQEGIEAAARCTLGWRNVVLDTKPLEFTQENARKLYARFPWIREQVDTFRYDRSNFLPD